jgi:hypothetical protein
MHGAEADGVREQRKRVRQFDEDVYGFPSGKRGALFNVRLRCALHDNRALCHTPLRFSQSRVLLLPDWNGRRYHLQSDALLTANADDHR